MGLRELGLPIRCHRCDCPMPMLADKDAFKCDQCGLEIGFDHVAKHGAVTTEYLSRNFPAGEEPEGTPYLSWPNGQGGTTAVYVIRGPYITKRSEPWPKVADVQVEVQPKKGRRKKHWFSLQEKGAASIPIN